MLRSATTLSSWIKTVKLALDEAGCDSDALFAEAGLDPAALSDPNARYPQAASNRLWQLAEQASGDPAFGLEVGRRIRQTTFHALGYSLLASATLKEVFERLVRYFHIVSDAAELEFVADGSDYRFLMHPPERGTRPTDVALDAMMSVIIRLCRALYGPDFRALSVSLMRPEPADREPFDKVFKAPLVFGAAENAIALPGAMLERTLDSANPELARINDEIVARYLAHFHQNNAVNRVHGLLVELLPLGEPSQEKVAAAMNMSLRNLQRKLSAEGSSYKAVLNDTRRELALSYIRDSRYSISEIAYLLGFADTSSFTRAFRRWTGESPRAYRDTP